MRCIYIYNPKSGRGKIKSKVNYIKSRLESKFSEIVIYETKSQEDTIQKAKETCQNFDVLIFSGGDGTFNDIACGVSLETKRPILGYIPSGTSNDIARNLKIPLNVDSAVDVILEGNTLLHDVGRINGQHFMYAAGIGTFTGVSYRAKHGAKKFFGRLVYALNGVKELLKPTISKITLTTEKDTINIDTPLLLILNSTYVAGIEFYKEGHLNDGMFDIIVVNKGRYKGLINIFKLFILGILRIKRKNYIKTYRSAKFRIDVEGLPQWTIDGEIGPVGSVEIENLHNHLEIYGP